MEFMLAYIFFGLKIKNVLPLNISWHSFEYIEAVELTVDKVLKNTLKM